MLSYSKQLLCQKGIFAHKREAVLYFRLYQRWLPSGTSYLDQLISGLAVQRSQGSAVLPQVGTKNAHRF